MKTNQESNNRKLYRILVVDDQPEITQVLEEFLHNKSFQVQVANSGKQALQLCHNWQPHIVLLDILMPEMDGFETLLKIQEWNPDATVIMITSLDDIEAGKRALELGASDYITKPLDFHYLEQTLLAKLTALFSDI
ncbi:MAG: response regulator [bacterium]|nr:response regulator [bacterium]